MSPRTSRGRRAGGPSEPSLPLVPLLVGVIVAGLAIGALFSSLGSKAGGGPSATPPPVVAVATPGQERPTPMPYEPTPVPRRRLRTPDPALAPMPTSDPDATPRAEPSPTVAPPTARPRRTARPATPEPTEPPEPTAAPATPRPRAIRSAVPVGALATPAAAGTPASAAAGPDPGATGFPHDAEELVRSYYSALRASDPAAAYAALGAPVGGGKHGESTAPEAMVGPDTRIIRVEARGGADASAVDVSFRSDGVTYFGHYIVERTPAGPVIRSHDVIRP